MFRLVVIPQLVLSLLVAPMLCCCTTARLSHEASPNPRTLASADQSRCKPCCGTRTKPTDAGRPEPGDPAKCSCKEEPAKAAVATPPVDTGDSLVLLFAEVITLDPSYSLGLLSDTTLTSARFDSRSSSPSTADLFFAHHRLRF